MGPRFRGDDKSWTQVTPSFFCSLTRMHDDRRVARMSAAKCGGARISLRSSGLPAHATPSFFCRLVDEVVYWKTNRLPG